VGHGGENKSGAEITDFIIHLQLTVFFPDFHRHLIQPAIFLSGLGVILSGQVQCLDYIH
jgi:hypothetical protein